MRDLGFLSISLFTWGVGEGIFLVFQPLYLQELGASPAIIGLALSVYGAVQIVTHVPAGYLSDRFGPKPLMLAAWVLGTVAAWAMALARTLPVFVIGMALYGATLFVLSPLNSYVTAARGKMKVGRAITLSSASFNLGGVVGPLIGGTIGDLAGLRSTYLLAASLFVLSTLMVTQIRPRSPDPGAGTEPRPGLVRNKVYRAYLLVVFVAMFATYLPQPLAANYLQNQQRLGLQEIGGLYSILGVGMVVLNILLGQLSLRLGLVVSQIAVGIFAGILWLASGFGLYGIGFFLLGGYRVLHSLLIARTRPLVGSHQIGLAYAWTETVAGVTLILVPAVAGLLYEIEPSLAFPLAILSIFVSLGILELFNRRYPERAFSPQPLAPDLIGD